MENIKVYKTHKNYLKIRTIVYYLLGVLEFIFAFRLNFKLLGVNPNNAFVSIIYSISGVFMAPFNSIFGTDVNKFIESKPVIEPSAIIAMIVYAIIVLGIIRLIMIFAKSKDGTQEADFRITDDNSDCH